MVESDHSDSESNQVLTEPNESNGNGSAKRPREESSDVETDAPVKKARTKELNGDENTPSNDVKKVDNEATEKDEEKSAEKDSEDAENTLSNDADTTGDSEKMDIDLKDDSDSEKKEIDESKEKKDVDIVKDAAENGVANGKSEEKDEEAPKTDSKVIIDYLNLQYF